VSFALVSLVLLNPIVVVVLRLISGVSQERDLSLKALGKVLWFVVSVVLKIYLSIRLVSRATE
jgi:hypothetical protein